MSSPPTTLSRWRGRIGFTPLPLTVGLAPVAIYHASRVTSLSFHALTAAWVAWVAWRVVRQGAAARGAGWRRTLLSLCALNLIVSPIALLALPTNAWVFLGISAVILFLAGFHRKVVPTHERALDRRDLVIPLLIALAMVAAMARLPLLVILPLGVLCLAVWRDQDRWTILAQALILSLVAAIVFFGPNIAGNDIHREIGAGRLVLQDGKWIPFPSKYANQASVPAVLLPFLAGGNQLALWPTTQVALLSLLALLPVAMRDFAESAQLPKGREWLFVTVALPSIWLVLASNIRTTFALLCVWYIWSEVPKSTRNVGTVLLALTGLVMSHYTAAVLWLGQTAIAYGIMRFAHAEDTRVHKAGRWVLLGLFAWLAWYVVVQNGQMTLFLARTLEQLAEFAEGADASHPYLTPLGSSLARASGGLIATAILFGSLVSAMTISLYAFWRRRDRVKEIAWPLGLAVGAVPFLAASLATPISYLNPERYGLLALPAILLGLSFVGTSAPRARRPKLDRLVDRATLPVVLTLVVSSVGLTHEILQAGVHPLGPSGLPAFELKYGSTPSDAAILVSRAFASGHTNLYSEKAKDVSHGLNVYLSSRDFTAVQKPGWPISRDPATQVLVLEDELHTGKFRNPRGYQTVNLVELDRHCIVADGGARIYLVGGACGTMNQSPVLPLEG